MKTPGSSGWASCSAPCGEQSAGMHFGIDERSESQRALQRRIEGQAELAQQGAVGSEAGGGDDLIDFHDKLTATTSSPSANTLTPLLAASRRST